MTDDSRPLVLVDARNVLRSQWPNIPEPEVVERTRRWAEEQDVDALVVFDGRAPGGLVGTHELDARCAAVGTGSGSADDWIAEDAERLAAAGRRYWLVTSDRELRDRAGGGAERVVGGGAFATTLAGFVDGHDAGDD